MHKSMAVDTPNLGRYMHIDINKLKKSINDKLMFMSHIVAVHYACGGTTVHC